MSGSGTKTKYYNKRCSYHPFHSGNRKSFRSSVPGTGGEGQIYTPYYVTVSQCAQSIPYTPHAQRVLGGFHRPSGSADPQGWVWESSCSLLDSVLGSHPTFCVLLNVLMSILSQRGVRYLPLPAPKPNPLHLACLRAWQCTDNLIGLSLCILRPMRAELPCVTWTGSDCAGEPRILWAPRELGSEHPWILSVPQHPRGALHKMLPLHSGVHPGAMGRVWVLRRHLLLGWVLFPRVL